MSFLDYDLEAQRVPLVQEGDNGASTKTSLIIKKTSNLLSDFANGTTNLERLVSQLGTKRDSEQLRQTIEQIKIVELNEYKQQLEHLTNDISHLVSSNPESTSEEKFSEEKLRKEFESINSNFNSIKRRYNEKVNSVSLSGRLAQKQQNIIPTRATETTPLFEYKNSPTHQQQQQLLQEQEQEQTQSSIIPQQELDIHSIVAEERANEIKKIHNGVEEINAIYKQLGYLVQQQGSHVDTIENNMSSFATHTQSATQELVRADNYQKKKKKWSCILLVVLIIFVLIAILAIFT